MADIRRYAPPGAQLDIEQILLEAQHRWLRPAEICEILQNHQRFQIAPEPPNRPPNGSLFLFDRKVLRYFRKDGHNWRKKKDGKTVKEAHERLKSGSVDVLHCYYAHGEENENFQRRSYWMLEEERSNIVLVHYREVKGNRANFNRIRGAGEVNANIQDTEDDIPTSDVTSSSTSVMNQYDYHVTSQVTDSSAPASEYEDAESAYRQHSNSGFHSFLELQPPVLPNGDDGPSVPYHPVPTSNSYQGNLSAVPDIDFVSSAQGERDRNTMSAGITYMTGQPDFASWGDIFENRSAEVQPISFGPSGDAPQAKTIGMMHGGANDTFGQVFTDGVGKRQDFGVHADGMEQWQNFEGDPSYISKWPIDQKMHLQSANDITTNFTGINTVGLHNSSGTLDVVKSAAQNDVRAQFIGGDIPEKSGLGSSVGLEGKTGYSTLRQPLLDGVLKEGLKKLDSFDRWMSKELGDVNESLIKSNSGSYWGGVGDDDGMGDPNISSQVHIDTYTMSPSLSQDQLFSIIDFSPNWGYSGLETKVLITGRFLKSQQELGKYKWACMFGELEVPAEVICDGVIRCHTPVHEAGVVPFYVTCSNRLACSEVREYEFRVGNIKEEYLPDSSIASIDCRLLMRFGKFLTVGSHISKSIIPSNVGDSSYLSSKIEALLKEEDDEWEDPLNVPSDKLSVEKVKDHLVQRLLKNQLHLWLLQKVAEGGKGPSLLDEGGQGVLHLAAALGYDWAIQPTLAAGVSVNFRDINGWTALHWAAFYGRERTVVLLVSLGASPGALTDPTPKYPSGRPAADLASSNGHKGIAGYLAEAALSSHLLSLKLKDNKEPAGAKDVETASERTATPIADGDLPHGLSLKDSLAAVRNATQAAARIHQVFRVQSFQRKQMKDYGDNELGISGGRALSLLSGKTKKAGLHDEPGHAAAIRIQNKFRSWKGRRDFLRMRQRVIKIQAHVRGHQVRKNYRSIIWSVGILDKVILRWRRKGRGLRVLKPDAPADGSSMQDSSSKEDDYDFLKEGRKQTEVRLEKALARVKSMVQYPEARDQYRRLLNVVSEMQTKVHFHDNSNQVSI
ncbi:OLC1v1009286C2 [Oldenlandia corymbosa var. corymbosa]|uniref:OLC1v1009286C2 n=1 Tax=Oldenlandia corymbosa var. corymbosa TaxID=529605 RepID=A0AAV1DNT2_OLDCO|nr:OLC1v1009286C2 [Oldenlandia corymbosa var. corymbosa]